MPRPSYAPLRRILSGMFSRSALDTQIWDSCRQGLRESCRDKCMKRPGPAVEKSVPPGESVQPSFQLYFGVPTELLARDMQPELAATPECTTEVELWASPGWGPIACKGWETKHVKKITSSTLRQEQSSFQRQYLSRDGEFLVNASALKFHFT